MGGIAHHNEGCIMICFGNLGWGVSASGLSYLNLNRALGNAWWNNSARLSEYKKYKQRYAFHAEAKINNLMPRASKKNERPLLFRKKITAMKKSCRNIDITAEQTIRPFVYECLKRHRKRYKFKRLLKMIRAETLNDAADKLSKYAANTIKMRTIPNFTPKTRERFDNSSRKKRLIGCETALQQIFDYIAVRSCYEIWHRRYVPQQCSSIKKRGQLYGTRMIRNYIKADLRAMEYAKKHKRRYARKCKYFIKLDIHHCYQSIDRRLFLKLFEHDCGNYDILYLWSELIASYARAEKCTGFLIGALPSQWGAQFMLSFLYRYAMAQPGVTHMIMFMDDMLLMSGNRRKLKRAVENINSYAKNGLHLEIKKNWHIKKLELEPIDMMGYVIHDNGKITVRAKNFIHARRMIIRLINKNNFTYSQAKRLASYKGYFKYSNCRKIKEVMHLKSAFEKVQNIISEHEKEKK